jgi:hypothetical protein
MASFDMGRAWNEAQAVLSAQFPLIAGLVAGGALAGAVIQYGVFGFSQAAFTAQLTAMTAGGAAPDPTAVFAALGSVLVAIFAGGLVSGAASAAATRLAVVPQGDSILSALVYGFIVTVVMLLVYVVGGMAFALVVGLIVGVLAAIGGGVVGVVLSTLLILAMIPLMIWLSTRLIVTTAAMAAVRSVNPLYGLSQSWVRTGPVQWPLLGYVILLIIAAIVISIILSLIGGGIGGIIGGGLGEAIGALFSAIPIGILSVAVAVGIWRVLAPDQSAEVFA